MMDHLLGSPCPERHVQCIEHQLCGQRGGHRPTNDATAEGVKHDREVEKARPGRDVGDIRNPQPIRRFCGEHGRRPPARPARSVLDGSEHDASLGQVGANHHAGSVCRAAVDFCSSPLRRFSRSR
jgi:hypothetical protein